MPPESLTHNVFGPLVAPALRARTAQRAVLTLKRVVVPTCAVSPPALHKPNAELPSKTDHFFAGARAARPRVAWLVTRGRAARAPFALAEDDVDDKVSGK
jgi:hypothetical protein